MSARSRGGPDNKVRHRQDQPHEPVIFTGLTYRDMSEGLLTGANMTQRQLHHQSSHLPGWQLTKTGSWELTAQSAGNCMSKTVLSRCLSCPEPFPCCPASWRVSLRCPYCLRKLGKKGT